MKRLTGWSVPSVAKLKNVPPAKAGPPAADDSPPAGSVSDDDRQLLAYPWPSVSPADVK